MRRHSSYIADRIAQQPVDQTGPHPDLADSLGRHGSVHTTGGRVLRLRRAATPDEQEARLANPLGWSNHVAFEPSQTAIQGARAYASKVGLGDPHQFGYDHVRQDADTVRTVGRHYDNLPTFDKSAVPHFQQMGREVNHQYDHLTNNMGIKVQSVDHDPYADVHEMMADINNNKRLKVMGTHVTGGHPLFSDADNDKFRAVHDFFGHAATGRSFDRHGEQAAYLAHSQMFSPAARPALASETKGQNTSLILNGNFGPQKIALMQPQHWNDSSLGGINPNSMGSLPDLGNLPKTSAIDENEYDISGMPQLIPENGGRWETRHQESKPGTYERSGRHEFGIHPANAPGKVDFERYGRPGTAYYDPTRTDMQDGDWGPEPTTKPNRISDHNPPAGMLWRGMSDEEYQGAKKDGYFQSKGEWNIGDGQVGKTYFSTNPEQAANYATGFSPWHLQPSFGKPGHVVGIPDRPEIEREGGTEVGVPGKVPFDQASHHFEAHPLTIRPGSIGYTNGDWSGKWELSGSSGPAVQTQWEPAHPPKLGSRLSAYERLAADLEDYQGEHQAPTNDGYNAPMHDLETFYPDVHQTPHFYDGGTDKSNLSAIRKAKDSPDARIEIYRAMPRQGRGGYAINRGDWVTTNKEYAIMHGLGAEDDGSNFPVVKATVPAGHLFTEGNSLNEWGYDPGHDKPKAGTVVARPRRKV